MLKGARHTNKKKLRFEGADGEWPAAFAFDPERRAILLVAGDKSGASQKRFWGKTFSQCVQKRQRARSDGCGTSQSHLTKSALPTF